MRIDKDIDGVAHDGWFSSDVSALRRQNAMELKFRQSLGELIDACQEVTNLVISDLEGSEALAREAKFVLETALERVGKKA